MSVILYVFILSYSGDNGAKLLTIKNNIMISYDDWKLATPDNEGDAINVECPECEGLGTINYSNCCGTDYDEDTGICLGCKEHSDNICETCEGTGLIET